MFVLAALLAAASLDDHSAFDGVIQFDSLQVPGTAGTIVTVIITACLPGCTTASVNAAAQACLIASGASATGGSATGTCGAGCTPVKASARGLLQVAAQIATITLTGVTAAQAQALQNQIAAGNLASVGIPATTVVVATTPLGVPIGLVPVSPVAILPSNPLSPANICQNAAITRFRSACITLATCVYWAARVNTLPGRNAACCGGCTKTTRRALQQANQQLVNNFPICPDLLAVGIRNVPGCGKASKKGLLGLLGLLGLIPLFLLLLCCCLCLLRRKRRGQAMLFSVTQAPIPQPLPLPVHSHVAEPVHFHP
jgi:hypothetical protein